MNIMDRLATFYDFRSATFYNILFGWNLVKIHGGWVLFVNDMSKIFILWINEWGMQYTIICFYLKLKARNESKMILKILSKCWESN